MAIAVRNNESLGITIHERDGYRSIAIPQEARDRANILIPVSAISQESAIWKPALHEVYLDIEEHTYVQQGGKRAINKQGLLLLANAAAISVVKHERERRDLIDQGEWGWTATIEWHRADGTLSTMTDGKIEDKNAKDPHGESKVATKALLRAMRAALAIPGSMTPARLALPFIVIAYTFSPDTSNPDVLAALVSAGTRGAAKMYGGIVPEVGTAEGEIPLAIAPAAASEKAPGLVGDKPTTTVEPVTTAPQTTPVASEAAPNLPGGFCVGYGKYEGSTLSWIAEKDPAYLRTLATSGKTVGTPEREHALALIAQIESAEL